MSSFDPVQFKHTTTKQWDVAADAWHRWGGFLNQWLGESTELMLDMGGIQSGSRVLDVAAGAGEQSITVAKRVGTDGAVLATDLSAKILEFAQATANREGISNLSTKMIDGENLSELNEPAFDAVISRVGLIYFPDQNKALKGMRDKLRKGGKVSVMVYATAEENQFFSIPVKIIRKRANLPAPLPGQPGPFSLGQPEVLKQTLEDAGFTQVEVKKVHAPLRFDTALDCLRFEQESFGALHQMLSGLSDFEQDEAWKEIELELNQFEKDGYFEGPCQMLVACGTR